MIASRDSLPKSTRISYISLRRDWHRFFYLATGLLACSGLSVLVFVPHQKTQRTEQTHFLREIDILGGFLVIVGLVLFFFVLTVAPGAKKGWATPCGSILKACSDFTSDPALTTLVGFLCRRTRTSGRWHRLLGALCCVAKIRGEETKDSATHTSRSVCIGRRPGLVAITHSCKWI